MSAFLGYLIMWNARRQRRAAYAALRAEQKARPLFHPDQEGL